MTEDFKITYAGAHKRKSIAQEYLEWLRRGRPADDKGVPPHQLVPKRRYWLDDDRDPSDDREQIPE